MNLSNISKSKKSMLASDMVSTFRHYIYGIDGETEEFLTTKLSEEDAIDYAVKHRQMFSPRFTHYSVRKGAWDEVAVVQ